MAAQPEPRAVDLKELVRRFDIEAYVLACEQRGAHLHGQPHQCAITRPDMEMFHFGGVQTAEKLDFEQELVARLSAVKEAHRDAVTG